jgi:hypothetical protein
LTEERRKLKVKIDNLKNKNQVSKIGGPTLFILPFEGYGIKDGMIASLSFLNIRV